VKARYFDVQLTDAIKQLMENKYAYIYKGKHYHIGNRSSWIKANVIYF